MSQLFQNQDERIYKTTPGWTDPPPQPPPQEQQQQQQPIVIQSNQPVVPVTRTLFLSTKHRASGTPNDAIYEIDAGIRSGKAPGERITVTPVFASLQRGWDLINSKNRRFQISIDGVSVDLHLKVGSGYSCNSFGAEVQKQIRTAVPAGFVVTYDRVSNRYTFAPPDERAYKILIPHRHLNGFFGFPNETRETTVFSKSNPLTSERNVSMSPQVSVVISCDLVTMSNLNNFDHRNVCATGILLVIPIDAPPYGELVYAAPTPDTGTLTLAANSVHHLRVWVTDETSSPIDVGEWVLGVRFDVYPPS
jgi:hypothetical protein